MTAIPHMDDASIDSGVPWHYGEPFKEQRTLVAGNGRVDLSHHGVVTVTGADRRSWLHSLTTQDFESPSTTLSSLILSPHGHIEHDLHVVDDEETTWISVEPGTAPDLVKYLDSMRFMMRVEVTDVSDQYAVIGAPGWIESSDFPVWHSPSAFLTSTPADKYIATRPADWQVSEIIVPRDRVSEVMQGHELVGTWAWEAHRIRGGVPRLNFETDHKTIPHEIGLISSSVHLNKGCYRGQETVARVYNLGKPPRRIVQLMLDGSTNDTPIVGDLVSWDGKEVGRVTSVTQDYESGPLALAVIKRSVPTDAVLTAGTVAASQTAIVE
ncbi:MAG: folate-binding protein [Actinomycetes bacterium]|jgi:tRNA-modifying protein YgfZ